MMRMGAGSLSLDSLSRPVRRSGKTTQQTRCLQLFQKSFWYLWISRNCPMFTDTRHHSMSCVLLDCHLDYLDSVSSRQAASSCAIPDVRSSRATRHAVYQVNQPDAFADCSLGYQLHGGNTGMGCTCTCLGTLSGTCHSVHLATCQSSNDVPCAQDEGLSTSCCHALIVAVCSP